MGARRQPYTPGTFRALRTAGRIWVACTPCRRYVELFMTAAVADRRVARARFRCLGCGGAGHLTSGNPKCDGYVIDPREGTAAIRPPSPGATSPPAQAWPEGPVHFPARGGDPSF